MRFDAIKEFDIEELDLDEENYRFTKADDQLACINKIYNANPSYFRGLMKSIAEDDLGELLLVYQTDEANVVADGNRRLSAMKVLSDDYYAPSESIKTLSSSLRANTKVNFKKIHAQVSNNRALISRTVYERHSGGKNGTSRVPWNAYAAARFGFDAHIGGSNEWYIMALLSKTEEEKPEIQSFIDGNNFSYEVFRRLVRAAIKEKKISENIFSERGERIKKTARADLISDAVTKTHQFLKAMEKKEISLSRKDGDSYADRETVANFISQFELSPDNKELETAKSSEDKPHDQSGGKSEPGSSSEKQRQSPSTSDVNGGSAAAANSSGTKTEESGGSDSGPTSTGKEYGVGKSDTVEKKIQQLGSDKLKGLYKSLYTVSLVQHPALMYVGAWSFLEVLSKICGNTNQDFPAYFRNNFLAYGLNRSTGKDCGNVLDDISKYGNAAKHSKNATRVSATQLKNDFEVLEPMILGALDAAINSKKID